MNKNLINILIGVAVIGAVIWWYNSSAPAAVPVNLSGTTGPTLQLVERLKKVEIGTSIFSDAQFLGLEAAPKVSIDGILKGRPNPFTTGRK